MNHCLFGGESGVILVTSPARSGPTPRIQQATTWKTSEHQDEYTTLFLPLIPGFARAAGI